MPFSGYDDLNPEFASRLQQMIAASGGRVSIGSGYRTPERQAELYAEAVRKYGSEAKARRMVAPPGKSHHNHGIAADLTFADAGARQWVHANAARFGLFFPMDWEPWHIEPLGIDATADPDAYTTPPTGYENPASRVVTEDPNDPEVQFKRLMGVMFQGETQTPDMDTPTQEVTAAPELPGPGTAIEEQLTQASQAGGMPDGT